MSDSSETARIGRAGGASVDIRQLETLLAVAEEGSFTAAADRLHTVQSNVSEHVRQLEAELGVQLLVREPARARCRPSSA